MHKDLHEDPTRPIRAGIGPKQNLNRGFESKNMGEDKTFWSVPGRNKYFGLILSNN